MIPQKPHLCDTLPQAKLAQTTSEQTMTSENLRAGIPEDVHQIPAPQPQQRKLCPRHKRMADEGTNLKLQQALDALPLQEREAVNAIWANFSASPHPRRALILQGLLTMCCFSQLSLLADQLSHIIRIDPFSILPHEVSLRVLTYLDATSLCRAAQVSKKWRRLADDNILWRGICEQHIGQKCAKCGWGLPRLEKKKKPFRLPCPESPVPIPPSSSSFSLSVPGKRPCDDSFDDFEIGPSSKRQRSSTPPYSTPATPGYSPPPSPTNPLVQPFIPVPETRPWKDVYCERLTIEKNWRRGRCTVRTLRGHRDGVMCLQINENLAHPSFPILITGSYDRTARVWNLETGAQIHCLEGHTSAIRSLQFDEVKLVTASMDCSIRIWNWRMGTCLRVLEGHTEGVVCVNFDEDVLASGSVDTTVKIWDFRNGGKFTLRGHTDWVNCVQLWDSNSGATSPSQTPARAQLGASPSSAIVGLDWAPENQSTASPNINRGKMLFSASDDGTIRLWDLSSQTCIQVFTGHVGQVQTLKLSYMERLLSECKQKASASKDHHDLDPSSTSFNAEDDEPSPGRGPVLISGSLDNTIKTWDISTGKAIKTFFGHIEGVWSVAADRMRLISGSHDRTIKIWDCEQGRCTTTLVGHRGAVTCLGLAEDKIVSGSDDGNVRIWSFSSH
ncbi:WD40-repeat-containing domain protein [Thelephora terrestris]|uniref:WD40-repeat-containing domain protein n=1 Tax=Thelephora terrestris TaxID=56493 RepID=A0A9P6LBJ6_9AGAM|nr:WD40-repeat-containing domain protein [Thelephora terrestris]